MSSQLELEAAVMALMLNGKNKVIMSLLYQYEHSVVVSRVMSSAGFVTSYQITDQSTKVCDQIVERFGDVIAQIDGLENGAGFLIQVKNGLIESLEGYSFDGIWPQLISKFSLSRAEQLSLSVEAALLRLGSVRA